MRNIENLLLRVLLQRPRVRRAAGVLYTLSDYCSVQLSRLAPWVSGSVPVSPNAVRQRRILSDSVQTLARNFFSGWKTRLANDTSSAPATFPILSEPVARDLRHRTQGPRDGGRLRALVHHHAVGGLADESAEAMTGLSIWVEEGDVLVLQCHGSRSAIIAEGLAAPTSIAPGCRLSGRQTQSWKRTVFSVS
jgi:hypothetical protein